MSKLTQDFRFSWRQLRHNPGFTFVATLTLALGIGANSAIFSIINEHLLRPLPYPEPERIVALWDVKRDWPEGKREQVTYLNYLEWRAQNQVFSEMSAFAYGNANYSGDGEAVRVNGLSVTEGYFRVLGVQPLLGRTFTPEECASDANPAVVLGYKFWQSQLGGGADVIGRIIRLNGQSHTVVGVMPPQCSGLFVFFGYQYAPELWTPLTPKPWQAFRGNHSWFAIARLKSGVTLERAQADMRVIGGRLAQQYPENKDWEVRVGNLQETIFGSTRPVLLSLLAAVGLVLLIACINVANLLLGRASRREKEIAIRTAVGASRLRIVRQLLTESLMLSVMGGGAGLLLAYWIIASLNSSLPGDRFILTPVQIDGGVAAFSLVISAVTAVLIGLFPALRASRTNVNESLKEGTRGSLSFGRHRLSRVLVVGEVTLSLVLLIGAGLLVQTFRQLWQVDLGFRPDKVLAMSLALSEARYPDAQKSTAFYRQLLQRVESLPGVAAAAVTSRLPLAGSQGTAFAIEGRPAPKPGEHPVAGRVIASSHYFDTLQIPLQRGRCFSEQDNGSSEKVALVSASLARRYWGDADPVGHSLWHSAAGQTQRARIVGVVSNVRQDGLEEESRPIIYFPHTQIPDSFLTLVVRTHGDPLDLVTAIRKELAGLDPDQPVFDIRTMDGRLSQYLAGRWLVLTLMGGFSLVALLLAMIGLYGVISYSVTVRTREIGVRLALGACRGEVMRMVLRQGLVLVLLGVGLGLVLAGGVTGILGSQLYGVTPTDPATFAAVVALLVLVALGACYLPARRATRIEPITALRWE
ncbi:MAG: ABC transporter permease [Acidobacteria bacterium]|nr:MAG: ABC transporter permease [Acidobacteriota bacterium]